MTGMCVSVASVLPGESLHVGCRSLGTTFTLVHHMSYTAYSILLSSSELTEMQVRVLSSALGVSPSSTDSDLNLLRSEFLSNLSIRRASLVQQQSNLFSPDSTFNNVETFTKPALIGFAESHGLDIRSSTLSDGRQMLSTHLVGGLCGIHRSGFKHLGCAALLALADKHNSNLYAPSMDLVSPLGVDSELAQINVLASVVKTLSKRPSCTRDASCQFFTFRWDCCPVQAFEIISEVFAIGKKEGLPSLGKKSTRSGVECFAF